MMLADQLKRILAVEEQERSFYLSHLKPALHRLEHAEDLRTEHSHIQKLVTGTVFEQALQTLNDIDVAPEHLYKLNHLFHEKMHANHMARQSEVESLLQTIAQPELNPHALYYLACLYSQGGSERDFQRADEYLHQALAIPVSAQQEELTANIRELLAQNYDRWQLRKKPPQPQKYGTQYADHHDVPKGLEKDHLIPPHTGYHYDMAALDKARKALGLCSMAEQEIRRRNKTL